MRRLWIAGLVSAGLYAVLLGIPDWGRDFARFAPVYGLLIVAYGAAAWGGLRRLFLPGAPASFSEASERRLLALIWAGAVVFRVLASAALPTLSDDLYRYLWDGRVLLHGVNPYRYAPTAPELAYLKDGLRPLINNVQLPTIYPPVLQLCFAAVSWVSSTVAAWKVFAAACDLGAGFFLMRALRAWGRPRTLVVAYLWHPLVIVEFAGNGHSDAVGMLLFCAALAAWGTGRYLRGGLALTLAGLVKFLPFAALPVLFPRLRWKWLLLPAVVVALYAPFHLHGVDPFGSLRFFVAKWRSNDFLFRLLYHPTTPVEHGLKMAKTWGAAVTGLVWLLVVALRRPWPSVFSWSAGALLLVSPVVHPWYVLWLLPAALVLGQPAWWLWTVTAIAAYAPLPLFKAQGVWSESMALKAVEYVPVLILIPVQIWMERRTGRGSRPEPGPRGPGPDPL